MIYAVGQVFLSFYVKLLSMLTNLKLAQLLFINDKMKCSIISVRPLSLALL